MSDPNIQKIKENHAEELAFGDIKKTVMEIKDYLLQIESDKTKRDEELSKIIEELMEEYE
jgi:hypothetical protein